MARTHWHYMNGEAGCIPDSADIYARQGDALDWADTLFGDSICNTCLTAMLRDLRRDGIHYFDSACGEESPDGGMCRAGATYVEASKCNDPCEAECERGHEISIGQYLAGTCRECAKRWAAAS